MAKRHFTKSYSTPSELVQLLRSRGLEISNEQKAENIGCYCLSAYMYPFLKSPKHEHSVMDISVASELTHYDSSLFICFQRFQFSVFCMRE